MCDLANKVKSKAYLYPVHCFFHFAGLRAACHVQKQIGEEGTGPMFASVLVEVLWDDF